jgi:putative effector of murein hydrolase LrgA (UPF0299 family)
MMAWGRAAVPDTIAEWWSILLVVLVGVFAVSCVNALAQSALAAEQQAAQRRHRKKQ